MRIAKISFISLFLSLSAPVFAGLNDLPAELLFLIADHIKGSRDCSKDASVFSDLDHFSSVSREMRGKLVSDDYSRKSIQTLKRSLLPKAKTDAGYEFTRRVDLELRFKEEFQGEIWQEPSREEQPGLIWFPLERDAKDNLFYADFLNAEARCDQHATALGLSIVLPTKIQVEGLFQAMKWKNNGYFPQILPQLDQVGFSWSSDFVSEDSAIVYLGNLGQIIDLDLNAEALVRCVLVPRRPTLGF